MSGNYGFKVDLGLLVTRLCPTQACSTDAPRVRQTAPPGRRQPGVAHAIAPVHQERYNLLKVDVEPQEARAKVRQDFGVRSVTLRAWELCPTWGED
jgi:hypothetical protein